MGTVYAVASGKGGVGKTTTAVNLGTALAGDQRRVAIVDADIGMADLAELVSLEPDGATLEDVLAGEAGIDGAVYRLTEGVFAVPSARDLARYSVAITDHLAPLVERLRAAFDVVVLDVGAGISQETVMPLGLADRTLLVTTPDPTAVKGAGSTATLVDGADGHVAGAVCTRVRPEDDPGAVVDSLPGGLLAAIPEDDAVRDSIVAGVPLVAYAPDSPAASAYREFAATLGDRIEADRQTEEGQGEGEVAGPTSHDEVAQRIAQVEGETTDGTDPVEADGGGPDADAEVDRAGEDDTDTSGDTSVDDPETDDGSGGDETGEIESEFEFGG